jgi:hypothetical protein
MFITVADAFSEIGALHKHSELVLEFAYETETKHPLTC